MSYWHVTPEYVYMNWTDEQLYYLTKALEKRLLKEAGKEPPKEISEDLIFQSAKGIKVNKDGN